MLLQQLDAGFESPQSFFVLLYCNGLFPSEWIHASMARNFTSLMVINRH